MTSRRNVLEGGTLRSRTDGFLTVRGDALTAIRRQLIIELAARHKLPAVYPARFFDGGLISYGPDRIDPYRRAAGYVDLILKGEKPAELPSASAAHGRFWHSAT